jgi:hypothetical protein
MMLRKKSRLVTVAVAAALLAGTAVAAVGGVTALPQLPDNHYTPNAETLQLGGTIAHTLLAPSMAQLDNLGDKITPEQRAKIASVTGPRGPEYIDDFFSALKETWPRVSENTEAILAHALAEKMSPAELRVGATFVQGPDGKYLLEIVQARTTKKAQTLSPEAQAAMARLESTQVGRNFLARATTYEAFLKPYTADLIATIAPPILGRFCHKVLETNDKRLAADTSDSDPEFAKAHAAGAALINHWYAKMTPEEWDKARHRLDDPMVKAQIAKIQRPEIPEGWMQAAVDASYEWLREDQAKIADEFGRFMARLYDAKEVEAFGRFIDGPYTDAVKKVAERAKAGQTMAANPKDPFAQAPELKQAFVDFLATPEGQSMKAKSMDFKRLVPAVVDEFVPLTAGLLVRFADKTEKMQAEKRLARGW